MVMKPFSKKNKIKNVVMKHCHLARLYCTFKSAASFGILSIVFLSNRVTYYSRICLSFYLFKQTNELQKSTCILCIYIYIYIREMLYLQYFYNKSQVVSCYWFKFETNTKITFLPQQ